MVNDGDSVDPSPASIMIDDDDGVGPSLALGLPRFLLACITNMCLEHCPLSALMSYVGVGCGGRAAVVVNHELMASSSVFVAGDAAYFPCRALGRMAVRSVDHSYHSGRIAGGYARPSAHPHGDAG